MSDPGRQLWFKPSDHAFIARHCMKRAMLERLLTTPPQPTYDTTTAEKGRIVRPNPAYTKMIELDREVRAEEQLIAGNPAARVLLEQKTLRAGTPDAPTIATGKSGTSDPAGQSAPSGPLGILKTAPPRPH